MPIIPAVARRKPSCQMGSRVDIAHVVACANRKSDFFGLIKISLSPKVRTAQADHGNDSYEQTNMG